jgi:hypothetical protein
MGKEEIQVSRHNRKHGIYCLEKMKETRWTRRDCFCLDAKQQRTFFFKKKFLDEPYWDEN